MAVAKQVRNQSLRYSEVASTGLRKGAVVIPSITQRKPDKVDCVRIVAKPLDVDIKSSRAFAVRLKQEISKCCRRKLLRDLRWFFLSRSRKQR